MPAHLTALVPVVALPDPATVPSGHVVDFDGVLHVSDGAAWAVVGAVAKVSTEVASYTLALDDAGTIVQMDLGTATTVTVPLDATVDFPIGTEIEVVRLGAGTVTIAPEGAVVLNSPGSLLDISAQYESAFLRKLAADEWLVQGSLA